MSVLIIAHIFLTLTGSAGNGQYTEWDDEETARAADARRCGPNFRGTHHSSCQAGGDRQQRSMVKNSELNNLVVHMPSP